MITKGGSGQTFFSLSTNGKHCSCKYNCPSQGWRKCLFTKEKWVWGVRKTGATGETDRWGKDRWDIDRWDIDRWDRQVVAETPEGEGCLTETRVLIDSFGNWRFVPEMSSAVVQREVQGQEERIGEKEEKTERGMTKNMPKRHVTGYIYKLFHLYAMDNNDFPSGLQTTMSDSHTHTHTHIHTHTHTHTESSKMWCPIDLFVTAPSPADWGLSHNRFPVLYVLFLNWVVYTEIFIDLWICAVSCGCV